MIEWRVETLQMQIRRGDKRHAHPPKINGIGRVNVGETKDNNQK